jgi:tRNA modification GTPase
MSSAAPASRTWIACLTPPGAAAIATLGLAGPDAWQLARRLFRPHSQSGRLLPEQPEVGRFWVGRLGQELSDEVVLTVRRAAPVPLVELHCHGGREVVRLLQETFQQHGAQQCSWADFERITGDDPLRAEAAVVLAQAPTVRTTAVLLDQYHGAFARAVQATCAALDHDDPAEAGRLLAELARYAPVGRRLTSGWRVAVAGAPNVGKSSLVNALAGYQRSIVSAVPGTTRDVVTTRLAVDGWPIELADTAGLRAEAAALEKQGVQRACAAAAAADLCLWVLDGSDAFGGGGVSPLSGAGNLRVVVNKVDLPAAWDWNEAAGALRVSARTGEGLAELCQALADWLVPEPPPPGAAVPFTPRLCDAVEEARRFLAAGRVEEVRHMLFSVLAPGVP